MPSSQFPPSVIALNLFSLVITISILILSIQDCGIFSVSPSESPFLLPNGPDTSTSYAWIPYFPSSPQDTTLSCWRWPIGVPTTLLFCQSGTRFGRTFSRSHGSAHTSQWPWFFRGSGKKSYYSTLMSLFHGTWGSSKSFRCSLTRWNVSSWGT